MVLCSVNLLSAQDMSLEELKAKKAELEASQKIKADEAAAFQGEIDGLMKQIQILSGWRFGVSGLVGFDFGRSSKWMANPFPTSSSSALAIGVTGFANRDADKYFWNNKLILNKAWQDVDLPIETTDDDLFDQGTVDLLNISSLAGYKLTDKIAISALGELNSSISSFLEPGTFDIGVGVTWTPIQNLVVVIHPLNYHIAWSADGDASSQGAIGAKIRADYQDEFSIKGKKIAWSSTFTTFIPYGSNENPVKDVNEDGIPLLSDPMNPESFVFREAGLTEYTWLNTFSFQIWKGIGVGFTFGLRQADFEFQDLQSFSSFGLSYTI